MNSRMNSRKMIKLLILTLSSLLIASVSAQLYSQMFMYSTVTVEGQYVTFVPAANTSQCGGTVTPGGEEVTFTNMSGKEGTLVTYQEAVNISNTDTVNPHNIELKLYSWTGEAMSTLRYLNITMYNEMGVKQGQTVHLVPGAGDVESSTQVSLLSSAMWRVQWDVFWWANATAGTDTVDATLVLIVG